MARHDAEGKLGKLWAGGAAKEPKPAEPLALVQPAFRADDSLTPVFPQDRSYVAFELRQSAERLHIVSASKMARHPAYHSLTDIIEDVFTGSAFSLVYPHMLVEVRGFNLAPIVHAIDAGDCLRIREFHGKLYDKPVGKGYPFIEKITITDADAEEEEPGS